MEPPVLILPGLYDSGPDHWQTLWEKAHPEFRRVVQADWERPRCSDWVARLEAAVRETAAHGPRGSDLVLVAHSLACTLVARWAALTEQRIGGALLVAPSDTEAPSFPAGTEGFTPMPLIRLPFHSIVVASTNDPYVSLERTTVFARAWGSELVNIGAAGHVNSASGLGLWTAGLALLERLRGAGRYQEVFRLVRRHIEARYRVAVVFCAVPPPFVGDLDGLEIQLDDGRSAELTLFNLVHLFGHTVQWNLAGQVPDIGTKAPGHYSESELREVVAYERVASQYGQQLLHEVGIHDLDPWLADCAASDVRYLLHYYETGEKLHLDEFWKTGSPLLDPLPIPQFTPRRLKLRSAGVVI